MRTDQPVPTHRPVSLLLPTRLEPHWLALSMLLCAVVSVTLDHIEHNLYFLQLYVVTIALFFSCKQAAINFLIRLLNEKDVGVNTLSHAGGEWRVSTHRHACFIVFCFIELQR